jgi:transposase
MPRPIPVPVRQAAFRLWQQGQTPRQIAEILGLADVSVRRLVRRFCLRGHDGIAPDYAPTPAAADPPSEIARAALQLRREHPTWGPA